MASFLTDYADQAVLLPAAAVLIAALFLAGWRRGALAWALGIVGVLGCMLALKVVFLACGPMLVGHELRSPSGHTASAAMIYGGLLALVARRNLAGALCCILLPVAVAFVIGVSRIALGAHSLLEVVIGGSVGVAGAAIAGTVAGHPPPNLRLSTLLAAIGAIALLLHGFHLPAEAAIRHHFGHRFWPLSACRPK